MKTIDEKCIKQIRANHIETEDNVIKKLWTSRCFSDFKIISSDLEFNVHRSVLALRSSVMKEIFENHKEATELKINDFSPNAVESWLYFIYTNEIIHEANVQENFIIAQRYKIRKMESAYEEITSINLDETNANETFLFADQHKTKQKN